MAQDDVVHVPQVHAQGGGKLRADVELEFVDVVECWQGFGVDLLAGAQESAVFACASVVGMDEGVIVAGEEDVAVDDLVNLLRETEEACGGGFLVGYCRS